MLPELVSVVVTYHVICEDDEALARQTGSEGDEVGVAFRERRTRRGGRHVWLPTASSGLPVAMRIDYRRERAFAGRRPVEVAAEVEAWQVLEHNVLDGESYALEPTGDARMERCLRRGGNQSEVEAQLPTQGGCPRLPGRERGRRPR